MKQDELRIIERLTGVSGDRVRLMDDGFWSRGYVIDGGRIVFKFRKLPQVDYGAEVRKLDFINSLGLGVATQKVGWVSPDGEYLGIYGVVGESLEASGELDYRGIGEQLSAALRKLHCARPEGMEVLTLEAEIEAWQKRYEKAHEQLTDYFVAPEIARFDDFVFKVVPEKLRQLGEKMVFSHGDLGDGNILVDKNGKAGIIDVGEMCYLDEAADFMDVGSDELREYMLEAYGADDALCEKVRIRVLVRPLIVLGDYIRRGDKDKIKQLVGDARKVLKEYGEI